MARTANLFQAMPQRRVLRASAGEPVAVWRAPAAGTDVDLGLGGHGGADSDLDALAFAFGDGAEDGHDQVMGFVVGVDRAADLGHPQRLAIVVIGASGAMCWSSTVRKLMKAAESLRRIRWLMTSPAVTSIAAMMDTVPCRLYSNSRRASLPGRPGMSGRMRVFAWMPVFSSMLIRTVPGGGSR